MTYGLWFDVENRYKTTDASLHVSLEELWFDVENRYKTTGDLLEKFFRSLISSRRMAAPSAIDIRKILIVMG